jgi:peptide/nickel transport system substrate-binding protein
MDKRFGSKLIVILVLVVTTAGLLLAGCASPTTSPGNVTATPVPLPVTSKDTIVTLEYGTPVSLDFMTDDGYDTASQEIDQATYETLFYFNGSDITTPVPILATGYDLSADGLVYTFYLRPNVTFHDGTAFNASAVKYSWDRFFLLDNLPAAGNFVGTVKGYANYSATHANTTQADVDAYLAAGGVKVINDTTVQVTLESPNSNFIKMLTFDAMSVMSPTFDQAHGGYNATAHTANAYMIDHTCGTGPFTLDAMVAGQPIVLNRNDKYWREPAKSKKVIIQQVDDWNTRSLALQKGEADFITVDAVHAPEVANATGNYALAQFGGLAVTPIQFNYAMWPYNIKEVRQALTELFDKDQYINSLHGYAFRRDFAIPKGMTGGDLSVTPQKYDPDHAVQLLNAAGFTPANKTNLVIDYNTGNENRMRASIMLADSVNAVENRTGVHMTAQNVDWKKEIPLMNAGKIPIYIVGWQADYPGADNFIAAFYWSGGQYMVLNSNPGSATTDALYKQSLRETDPAKQVELYKQIIEAANADYPYCYLYQAVDLVGYNKDLKGVNFNPLNGGVYVNYYTIYK